MRLIRINSPFQLNGPGVSRNKAANLPKLIETCWSRFPMLDRYETNFHPTNQSSRRSLPWTPYLLLLTFALSSLVGTKLVSWLRYSILASVAGLGYATNIRSATP